MYKICQKNDLEIELYETYQTRHAYYQGTRI